ncbi:hypothetical protein Tco_0546558 [Tanacetum coccineum]
MVAYLQKSEGSEGFHQIIDFLNASHIQYALTKNPTIYVSFIKQFWRTATARTSANGEVKLTATSYHRQKAQEIFEQLALMRYVTTSDSLTFQKGYFSPQWNFFIHTILHCLIPKKTAWEQFSSNIATAINCQATNHTFNFSNFVFEDMWCLLLIASLNHFSKGVHLLGREEGSLTLNELMVLCTTLSKKVEDLQNDLQQTKKVYSSALTKLILRVISWRRKKVRT